ncbi:MAG: hypothetical protein PHH13_04220 [Candidatus Peribacteraceae bacterium]|nr:hypothetical protein [Candidatus Peribacteraceae bacterium]
MRNLPLSREFRTLGQQFESGQFCAPVTLQDFLRRTRGLLGRTSLFGRRIGGTGYEGGMEMKGTSVPRPTPPPVLPRAEALEIPQAGG